MGCGASKNSTKTETFEEKLQRVQRQVEERDLDLGTASNFGGMPAERDEEIEQKRRQPPQPKNLLSRLESVDDYQPLPATHRVNGARRQTRRTSAPTVASFRQRDDPEDPEDKPRRRRKSAESKFSLTTPSGKLDREKLRQRVAEKKAGGGNKSDARSRRKSLEEPRRRRSSVRGESTNSDVLQQVMRRKSTEGGDDSRVRRGRRTSASDMVAAEAEGIVADVRVSVARTNSETTKIAAKYLPKTGKLNPHAPPGM
jgi:hypothetical protein